MTTSEATAQQVVGRTNSVHPRPKLRIARVELHTAAADIDQ